MKSFGFLSALIILVMLIVPVTFADGSADVLETLTNYYEAAKNEDLDSYVDTLYLEHLDTEGRDARIDFIRRLFAHGDVVAYSITGPEVAVEGSDAIVMYQLSVRQRGPLSSGGTGEIEKRGSYTAVMRESGGWKVFAVMPTEMYLYQMDIYMQEAQADDIDANNEYVVARMAETDPTLSEQALDEFKEAYPEYVQGVPSGSDFGKVMFWLILLFVLVTGGYFAIKKLKGLKSFVNLSKAKVIAKPSRVKAIKDVEFSSILSFSAPASDVGKNIAALLFNLFLPGTGYFLFGPTVRKKAAVFTAISLISHFLLGIIPVFVIPLLGLWIFCIIDMLRSIIKR